jgi:hypothetical protein
MANIFFQLLASLSLTASAQGSDDSSNRFDAIPLPPVTREQLDNAFNSRFAKPNLWNRFFPFGKPSSESNSGIGSAQIPDLMKLMAGLATGKAIDPLMLQKLLGAMGGTNNSFDPSLLKDLMAMAGRLENQRDTLEKAFPDMDWSRFSELIAKFRANPSRDDSVELMKFLEQLRTGVGPLGPQDISGLNSLLEKFRSQQPNPASLFPQPPPGGSAGTLPTNMLPPDALGRLSEFLAKLGLNQQQIAQVSDWLKAIPAPGLKGNLAEWAAQVDWKQFSPGQWRTWSPAWAVSAFDNLKPHLGFLKYLPSFRMPRLPNARLPRLPMMAFEAPKMTWRDALVWLSALLVPALLLAAFLYKKRIHKLLNRPATRRASIPANITDIHSLVQLYEMEAVKRLGPQARFRNIRRIEADLMKNVSADNERQAVRLLTGLYERWRYLPQAWHPAPTEIQAGTTALSLLVAGHTP